MRGWTCCEATVGELIDDLVHRVLTRGIEVERELDERGSLFVDPDCADLAPVDPIDGVEVSDGGSPDRPATLCLLRHLVRDVRAVLSGAVLVEGGQDAVHELPNRRGVNLLRGGDELDAALLEVGHDDGVIDTVAGEPGELVDDDVVNVAVAANAFEHLLEGNSLGHLGGGSPGFDVLGHDRDAELFGLALTGNALGRNGDAFGVVVGVHLALGAHTQVDNRAAPGRCVHCVE
ncbi:hypothetical protein NH287_01255 [Microbacterium sp. CnD16-F]|nr:hypothetical protein [Microbacterium sp. CnD16-F]MCO7202144.1 hypothetical protein [Microbacterium sp. CnD16-F]